MPTVTNALKAFLANRRETHNDPAFLDRWTPAMETQWLVRPDGEPVPGKRNRWTDGVDEWFHGRIPRNADSEPEWRDYEMPAAVVAHLDAIGCTGWNWVDRQSLWVGFDFDAITGHAAGVGVTADQLERTRQAAAALPYVESRRSTRGGGIHLYAYLAGIPTANHTEHAALGRAILGMMSRDAGFDFGSAVDACGGNLWIWHRSATKENRGFELIKPSERQLGIADVPANWRDEADVVSRKRAKVQIRGVSQDEFDALASSRPPVTLDATHREIMAALEKSGYTSLWVPDHQCLQTHTAALKKVHGDLKLTGVFETLSTGTDPGSANCFCFPLKGGAFHVVRFGRGCQEAATWDKKDWTGCNYNVKPDLATAARAFGGLEDEGGWVFKNAAAAVQAAESLGHSAPLPEKYRARPARLKVKNDKLIMAVDRLAADGDDTEMAAWIGKPKLWIRLLGAVEKTESAIDSDHFIRALVTPSGEDAGFVLRSESQTWDKQPTGKVKMALQHDGHSKDEAECIMGGAVKRRWELVNLPFQPEYPGKRRWNLGAAQLRFTPGERDAPHPHWDKILDHAGQSLTPALKADWARDAGIVTGADYLRALFACIIREPFQPTPYLFCWGPENSGKSILWEAFDLLVTRGVVKADRALTNQNDFNGELAGAILCVVEEKDISKTPGALNKIKDYVTSRTLSIRRMRTDSYSQPNTTHWMQFANTDDACPIFPGDTRITSAFVPSLPPGAEIPKAILLENLTSEAPAFLRTILDLTLPALVGRLRLPVVETAEKLAAQEYNRNPLDDFIAECCIAIPGARVPFGEFFERFQSWLSGDERGTWTKRRMARALPSNIPTGAGAGSKRFVGNVAFEQCTVDDPTPWRVFRGRLMK